MKCPVCGFEHRSNIPIGEIQEKYGHLSEKDFASSAPMCYVASYARWLLEKTA